ncbi:GTP-sensing pleiotropic transcriptional regulator CodY [Sinanaerobacter sp. ZZT-01]|uniref:GTP-sensing pleiotropic transcriptional regulator CodY n=1 Tax=Sinanaerobacter sp. ZZT-01 TaxID=3111540 RepID=UPI002D797C15|nr:GTP-sensing pleiotropic transcriptional regulator CodY [Sinanaerobacter sp. ZZT-01]WRR92769.1 GTP-sensing pleiotropic transcriptional regulator CodY [Sinanaerobacter sp. ZZT-01]
MGRTLLEKIRKLNWMLQESVEGAFSFNELCEILSDLLDGNVYVASRKGKVIGVHYKDHVDSAMIMDAATGSETFPNEYNDALLSINETRCNLKDEKVLEIFKYDYDTAEKLHTIIPIFGGKKRQGTLIVARYEPEFTDEDIILGEYGATVVGLEIQRRKAIEAEEEERKRSVVRMAIGTLSYSEAEAVRQIFKELQGNEGLLVASKIADRSGITRSVIVNALRKLESAGVIESRSLGMKGTHIKIINSKFKEELAVLDN